MRCASAVPVSVAVLGARGPVCAGCNANCLGGMCAGKRPTAAATGYGTAIWGWLRFRCHCVVTDIRGLPFTGGAACASAERGVRQVHCGRQSVHLRGTDCGYNTKAWCTGALFFWFVPRLWQQGEMTARRRHLGPLVRRMQAVLDADLMPRLIEVLHAADQPVEVSCKHPAKSVARQRAARTLTGAPAWVPGAL